MHLPAGLLLLSLRAQVWGGREGAGKLRLLSCRGRRGWAASCFVAAGPTPWVGVPPAWQAVRAGCSLLCLWHPSVGRLEVLIFSPHCQWGICGDREKKLQAETVTETLDFFFGTLSGPTTHIASLLLYTHHLCLTPGPTRTLWTPQADKLVRRGSPSQRLRRAAAACHTLPGQT